MSRALWEAGCAIVSLFITIALTVFLFVAIWRANYPEATFILVLLLFRGLVRGDIGGKR